MSSDGVGVPADQESDTGKPHSESESQIGALPIMRPIRAKERDENFSTTQCNPENKNPKRDWFDYTNLVILIFAFVAAAVAACEAYRLANLTNALVTDAQDTAKRQFRAYVLYDSGIVVMSPDGHSYTVSVSVKNSGQTPAYSVRYDWYSTILDFPLKDPIHSFPNPPTFSALSSQESADIGASGFVTLGDARNYTISPEDLVAVRDRKKAIYVVASITYHDTFHRDQGAKFIAVNIPSDVSGQWTMRNYLHTMPDNP